MEVGIPQRLINGANSFHLLDTVSYKYFDLTPISWYFIVVFTYERL